MPEKLRTHAVACVTEKHPGFYYYDDIEADLTMIARGLLVGKTPPLFAKMRIAYEAKLFPCSWKRQFPEGKLLILRLW